MGCAVLYEHKKHAVSPHFTHIGTTSVVSVAGSYQNLRAQISLVVGPLQWKSPFL